MRHAPKVYFALGVTTTLAAILLIAKSVVEDKSPSWTPATLIVVAATLFICSQLAADAQEVREETEAQ